MNFGKLLLLGVGGFLLYKYFVDDESSVSWGREEDGQPRTNMVAELSNQILAEARKNGYVVDKFTVDQWNWFYTQATGLEAPSIEELSTRVGAQISREALLDAETYIRHMGSGHTTQGLGGFTQFNTVAMASPYEMLNIRNIN